MTDNVDEEWALFMSESNKNYDSESDDEPRPNHCNNNNADSNNAHIANKLNNALDFSSMCTMGAITTRNNIKPINCNAQEDSVCEEKDKGEEHGSYDGSSAAPTPTDIYISTKSKIEYLNTQIDIKHLFWNISIMPYGTPSECIIKKQIKFNSLNAEELAAMQEKLKLEPHYEEHIIKSIINPDGRIKFKDVRKLSIGLAKKDIMNYRSKKKSAFYNCLVLIMRLKIDDLFREFHIKIFNTGKIELPGMQTDSIHKKVLLKIIETIQPYIEKRVEYLNASDTILINSNFNCGFYINREALYSILKNKYNVETIYDSCSYPGIQCKIYHDSETGICFKNDKPGLVKISFMIFRTGSILIVGMCNEDVLMKVYDFIKVLLQREYHSIGQKMPEAPLPSKADKKTRKKIINMTQS